LLLRLQLTFVLLLLPLALFIVTPYPHVVTFWLPYVYVVTLLPTVALLIALPLPRRYVEDTFVTEPIAVDVVGQTLGPVIVAVVDVTFTRYVVDVVVVVTLPVDCTFTLICWCHYRCYLLLTFTTFDLTVVVGLILATLQLLPVTLNVVTFIPDGLRTGITLTGCRCPTLELRIVAVPCIGRCCYCGRTAGFDVPFAALRTPVALRF